jgi:hypothetical protein
MRAKNTMRDYVWYDTTRGVCDEVAYEGAAVADEGHGYDGCPLFLDSSALTRCLIDLRSVTS